MSRAEDMARRPQPGPHCPLAKPQPPQGLRRPPARRLASERDGRASKGRGTRPSGLPGQARGAREVGGRVPDRVGRAHPAPRRTAARADSSRTDFCGPNCPKPGSAGSEPPHAAAGGESRDSPPGWGSTQPHPRPTPHRATQCNPPKALEFFLLAQDPAMEISVYPSPVSSPCSSNLIWFGPQLGYFQ